MKKLYHSVGTIPKPNRTTIKTESKSISLTHSHVTASLSGLVQTLQ